MTLNMLEIYIFWGGHVKYGSWQGRDSDSGGSCNGMKEILTVEVHGREGILTVEGHGREGILTVAGQGR